MCVVLLYVDLLCYVCYVPDVCRSVHTVFCLITTIIVILFKENILGKIQNVKVFAKIESLLGVNNISEIVEKCDGIVVARGDLLLSAPMKDFYQNTIAIAKATSCARKQLIFVTDILKSLDTQNIPLRSEIIDYQIMKASGADAVILDSSVLYRKRTHILKDALDAL